MTSYDRIVAACEALAEAIERGGTLLDHMDLVQDLACEMDTIRTLAQVARTRPAADPWLAARATSMFLDDDIEIDDEPVTSGPFDPEADGTWVSAWVWVPN